jgi:hypothetical protein
LIRIVEGSYYEVNLRFGERLHRVLLPIERTIIINKEPELEVGDQAEIER